MTLAEFKVELAETNRQLKRIAEALEWAVGLKPIPRPENVKKADLADVSRITNFRMAALEADREMQRQNPLRGNEGTVVLEE